MGAANLPYGAVIPAENGDFAAVIGYLMVLRVVATRCKNKRNG
jgi:hypothetical protein